MSSYIYTIKDAQGNQVEGFDQVGQLIFDCYKQLLGKQSQSRSSIKGNVIEQGPILTAEQQISMCKGFIDTEIKEAIFSISDVKSPGPDGYTSGFFKIA